MDMYGHNNPPPSVEDLSVKIDEYENKVGEFSWLEVDQSNASNVRDVISMGTKLLKEIDQARKDTKEPYMTSAKRVDDTYRPLPPRVKILVDELKSKLQIFMLAEEVRKKAEADKARKKAEEALVQAEDVLDRALNPDSAVSEEEAKEALRQSQLAEIEAEHTARKASSGVSVASRNQSSRAAALKTYRKAEITDTFALAKYYAEHPTIQEAMLKLANAEVRSAKGKSINIPGIIIIEEKRIG